MPFCPFKVFNSIVEVNFTTIDTRRLYAMFNYVLSGLLRT